MGETNTRRLKAMMWHVTLLGLAMIVAGCGTLAHVNPTARPLPPRTVTPTPTETPRASESGLPTFTPTVAATAAPTATPELSRAPTRTRTPSPTASPTRTQEPTATTTPLVTETPPVELASIGTITADLVGEDFAVEGTVVGTASFSHGFKFTLDDGTGVIVLLMWHDVYDDCWDAAQINLGATVQARGEVSLYEGQLQIEPHFGGEVKVIAGGGAQAPRRDIGSLSGADEGERVMIEGEVIRTEGLSSGVKVFLKDETGEILVLVWNNVLDRIERNTALGTPGSRVRVVGTTQVYRSNLEIVPALPNDVMVLDMP